MYKLLVIFSKTPFWVWAVLSYVLWIGYNGLYNKWVFLPRLCLTPLIFVLLQLGYYLKLSLFYQKVYVVGYLVGVLLGFLFSLRYMLAFNKSRKMAFVPGSWTTIVVSLIIFFASFLQGVLASTNPLLLQQTIFIFVAVKSLAAGFLLGKVLNILSRYLFA